MIGTVVGHYRVTARLSAGGMGIVYRAEHTLLGKPAAVKILHPELSTNREIVNRFFNEAKATTSIRHVGIVEVFDFGYLESGHAYLVMELLEGEPLSAAIRRSRFSQTAAVAILRGVCSALGAAHAKGIIHRDLKPDNIFLVPDADAPFGVRAKLLDFGIAKLTDVSVEASATRTGAVMGTPTYMSPEQCRGTGEVDHRADLYSLGCVLYEMLCGRPPFTSQGAGELIGAHQYVVPESPRVHAPELSQAIERLVLSLLAKSPGDRPPTAADLVMRFDELARSGLLSGISYELSTSGSGLPAVPRLTPPPSRASVPRMTPATNPLRPHDAPTLATPYSVDVRISDVALGAQGQGPTTLSGASGATGHGAPRRFGAWKVVAGLVAGAALVAGAVVLVPRAPATAQDGGSGVAPATSIPLSGTSGDAPATSGTSSEAPVQGATPPESSAAAPDAGVASGVPPVADASSAAEATSAAAGSAVDAGSAPTAADETEAAASAKDERATKRAGEKGPRRGKSKPKGKPKTEGEVPTLIEDDI